MGRVRTQLGKIHLRNQVHGDWLFFNLLHCRKSIRRLLTPFGRATHGSCMFDRDLVVGQQRVDGIACVLRFHQFNAIAIIDSTLIAQFPLLIKDKNVRCRLRPVSAGHLLRVAVVKIGVGQVFVGDPNLHFIERIARIR